MALDGRPEAKNLVGIYAAVTGESVEQVLARFAGQGFGAFKPALADALVALIAPIRERLDELRRDPAELDRILADGCGASDGDSVRRSLPRRKGRRRTHAITERSPWTADQPARPDTSAPALAAARANRRGGWSGPADLHGARGAASLARLGRPAVHLRRDQRAAASARNQRLLRASAPDRLGADGVRTRQARGFPRASTAAESPSRSSSA